MSIDFNRIWKAIREYDPLPDERKQEFLEWLKVKDEKSLETLTVAKILNLSGVNRHHLKNTGTDDIRTWRPHVKEEHRYSFHWRATQDEMCLRLDERFYGRGASYEEAALAALVEVWMTLTYRFDEYEKSKQPEEQLKPQAREIKPNPYTRAIIYFPESDHWKIFYKEGLREIKGNELSFTWGDYLVEAELHECFIPRVLIEDQETEKRILEDVVKPTIVGVVADLRPAEAVIGETRELTKQGNYEDHLRYERDVNYSKFFVYPKNWEMIRKLMAFGYLSSDTLKKEHQDLHQMAAFLGRESHGWGRFYVKGSNLEEALQRNLQIHRAKQRIDELQITGKADSLWYFNFGRMSELFKD